MSCNLQLVETCSVFLCIVLHRCYCISIIVILSTVFRTSHRCINVFLPQKIKKNTINLETKLHFLIGFVGGKDVGFHTSFDGFIVQ